MKNTFKKKSNQVGPKQSSKKMSPLGPSKPRTMDARHPNPAGMKCGGKVKGKKGR